MSGHSAMGTLKLTVHKTPCFVSSAFSFAADAHTLAQSIPTGNAGTGALWFRGHADEAWELKPSIGRNIYEGGLYSGDSKDLYSKEKSLLARFRRDAYPFVQRE